MMRYLKRPRFTLTAMLLLITVVAIPLAYVAQRRAWNLRRRAAYEILVAKGIGLPSDGFGVRKTPVEALTLWQWLVADEPALAVHQVRVQCDSDGLQGIPKLSVSELHLLRYFPEIQELAIWGSCKETDDETIGFISQFRELKSLKISDFPNVRGEFLKRLRCKDRLETLVLISLERLEGKNLIDLETFCSLDLLDVVWCPRLTDETLRGGNLPPKIKYLTVSGSIGDETLGRWLETVCLTHLVLDTSMSRDAASLLNQQTDLESIRIANATWIDEDFQFLKECSRLKELRLTAMPIRGELLNWLPHPEEIRMLDLCSTLLADSHLATLARFERLEELKLNFTPITGIGFRDLKWLPEQCDVELVGTCFTDEGKRALAHCIALDSFGSIHLPANWTAEELSLLRTKPSEWQVYLPAGAAVDTKRLYGEYSSFYFLGDESRLFKLPDRCSAELMGPVLALHEQARRSEMRVHEINRMIKEERLEQLYKLRDINDDSEK